jgi:DNA-binding MurR/RpiR family transcriptional regulator
MNITKRKEKIKERFGEKYLEFMQDLSNISFTHKHLSEKWKVSVATIHKYIEDLGYHRTGHVKMQIRNTYKVQRRVKEREETMKKIMKILVKS